ncbi:MAG: formate dehydrogenase accessory sulfurtransferase FdhD [Betaproteobacteria bacterium]|nr:formate dehydrogenase accessory sulfurtransferase FdhD [Betaproteobacteria bacterium]
MQGLDGAHTRVPVRRCHDDAVVRAEDQVAEECPVAFVYNGIPFAVMLATPLDFEDFAWGFSLTEGIVESAGHIQAVEVVPEDEGFSVYLSIPLPLTDRIADRRRSLAGRTGCGLCGAQMLSDALRPVRRVPSAPEADARALRRAHTELAAGQSLNALTGSVHAAAFADRSGRVRLLREDVGRHNALDKMIGALLRGGTDPSSGFAAVTSRASYEMVHKTAAAGIPLLSAVSAPTALAVRTASQAGLTLIGFARQDRHTVYSSPSSNF